MIFDYLCIVFGNMYNTPNCHLEIRIEGVISKKEVLYMQRTNKNNSDVVVVYCRYKVVNGTKVYPKKAKAFRMVFPKRNA